MKKEILMISALVFLLQFVLFASAATCDLNPILLSQDPYPAVPGESVKVVFQVDGLTNSDCGYVNITLKEAFPFRVDEGYNPTFNVKSGIYVSDFSSFLLIPYKIIVDKDALEGENLLDLDITASSGTITHSFDIEVVDSRTDFEVSVKNYDKNTQIITFEILNSGEHDIEALTIDVPKQDTLSIKGSSRNIIGSLDSNDDTTFSFEGSPSSGDIGLIITYTDAIDERRTVEKIVSFDMDYFDGRATGQQGVSIWFYITLILLISIGVYWWRKRVAQKRRMERHVERRI